MKRLVVAGLSSLCGLLDGVPRFDVRERRWYRRGCWGCWPLRLADLSARLDEKWGTGVWEPVPPEAGGGDV